jgi:hypothetical protein
VTFSDAAVFSEATFCDAAVFHKATFSDDAEFDGAAFSNAAMFSEATFSDAAEFDGVRVLHLDDADLNKGGEDPRWVWPKGWTVRPDADDPSRGTLVYSATGAH